MGLLKAALMKGREANSATIADDIPNAMVADRRQERSVCKLLGVSVKEDTKVSTVYCKGEKSDRVFRGFASPPPL